MTAGIAAKKLVDVNFFLMLSDSYRREGGECEAVDAYWG